MSNPTLTNGPNVTENQPMLVKLSTGDGVPKLFCPICNKALTSLNGYVKHVKKHESPGGFFCRYCEARFCTDEDLKRHRDTIHVTIACRLCKNTTFTNEGEYRIHIRDVHKGVDRELFKCDKCGAEYKTIDPYRRHISTECGTKKPYKCEQCSMTFVTKYNLKQHIEFHTGELKYCCSYCGKNFYQKGRLVEHERSHTGEKPYKCDVCGKCFSHRESLVTHSTVHTGIRLVECRCCQSRFSCYSNLIKHRRTRPDTCGLPDYDPPKNRVRKFTSRIPATLNPTSEIKVSNVNKIIKPDDQEKIASQKKENDCKPKSKIVGGSRKEGLSKKVTRKTKLSGDTENMESSDITEEEDNETDKLKKLLISNSKKRCTLKLKCSDQDDNNDDDDLANFENDESDVDEDNGDFKLPAPTTNKAEIKKETLEEDLSNKIALQIQPFEDFEYSTLTTDNANVKSEDEEEKNRMLECLNFFSECDYPVLDDDVPLRNYQKRKVPFKYQLAENVIDDILEETELILIKDEDGNQTTTFEEDILEVKPTISSSETHSCKVLLEDVTKYYPQLKGNNTVKLSRNAFKAGPKCKKLQKSIKSSSVTSKYKTKGIRRSSHISLENVVNEKEQKRKTFRLSKISQKELKERLKMAKKQEKSWQCLYCIKIYYMRKPYEKHLRDDHKRSEEEIREIFKSEDTGLCNEDVFKCHICDKIYLMEKRLVDHIEKHGADGNLIHKCPCFCSLYFATREEAIKHAHEVHKDLLWCEICQKFMTGCDALKSHNARVHGQTTKEAQINSKRNFVCDKCGRKFLGRTQLTDHVRSDCGRLPIYQCQECGKCLTTAGILKTHMLLHKADRPYQCDQCGKTFKIKAQYKAHLKYRHSDEKHFKCHLCPKAYPYRESLLTHMTVHTGIKRFLCNGCGKRFTCVSNLQAHRKVQADTCGLLPLNAKATQYMGVQKGNLLMGAKPEAGLDYIETNTLVAKDVLNQDQPMAQELNNGPSDSSLPLATAPLHYAHSAPPALIMPTLIIQDSHQSWNNYN
uniref:C2H2-type domain-containing protein n=1 Tax=Glossina pallidipes TaxID=7398 RepID=A0A1A9Z9G2_GLOPL